MLITIGRVLKPHGVRGEIRIEPLTDHPGRFEGLRRVYLAPPSGPVRECRVLAARSLRGAPLLKLEGYDSPEQARALSDWLLQIPREEALPLPDGRYYWFELIGMEVVTESGESLGTIEDIFPTGSNDVYVVRSGRREIYLPATKEVVRQVDRAARRMMIHVMDGLLD